MNCSEVQNLIHPFVDSELDLVPHVQIEEHLKTCDACSQQERQLRALRVAVGSPSHYYHAPASLRNRLQVAAPQVTRHWRRPPVQWVAIAASLLFMFAVGDIIGRLGSSLPADGLDSSVVDAHVRSLQANHLTDVASTDRHSVKPWFSGKLDFAPEVPDLSAEGFPLSGGRLDYLADRPVAALVYYSRLHPINLFIWPAVDDSVQPIQQFARQGYHIRRWQQSGMSYWAISDLNDEGLDQFVRLIQENSPAQQTSKSQTP
jgi:anti-sigma factor RsiW